MRKNILFLSKNKKKKITFALKLFLFFFCDMINWVSKLMSSRCISNLRYSFLKYSFIFAQLNPSHPADMHTKQYFTRGPLYIGVCLYVRTGGPHYSRETGVNFINVLRAAFAGADPVSTKKDSQVVSLFYAFGICVCKSYS